MLIFIGVPAQVIWLARRRWSDYGVTLANWPFNLEIGLNAYLVLLIPFFLGFGGTMLLKTNYNSLPGALIMCTTYLAAITVMLLIFHSKEKRLRKNPSGRTNLIVIVILLLFPIIIALAMRRLGLGSLDNFLRVVLWDYSRENRQPAGAGHCSRSA